MNLNLLETFRTKEELINYFEEIGQNITEEEIDVLKESYENSQKSDIKLNLKQLDKVVGGAYAIIHNTKHGTTLQVLGDTKLLKVGEGVNVYTFNQNTPGVYAEKGITQEEAGTSLLRNDILPVFFDEGKTRNLYLLPTQKDFFTEDNVKRFNVEEIFRELKSAYSSDKLTGSNVDQYNNLKIALRGAGFNFAKLSIVRTQPTGSFSPVIVTIPEESTRRQLRIVRTKHY